MSFKMFLFVVFCLLGLKMTEKNNKACIELHLLT